jgi:hypothetical protein
LDNALLTAGALNQTENKPGSNPTDSDYKPQSRDSGNAMQEHNQRNGRERERMESGSLPFEPRDKTIRIEPTQVGRHCPVGTRGQRLSTVSGLCGEWLLEGEKSETVQTNVRESGSPIRATHGAQYTVQP